MLVNNGCNSGISSLEEKNIEQLERVFSTVATIKPRGTSSVAAAPIEDMMLLKKTNWLWLGLIDCDKQNACQVTVFLNKAVGWQTLISLKKYRKWVVLLDDQEKKRHQFLV